MRSKANNLPWMGRTAVTAVMVIAGLGVFGGSAEAQNTPLVLDNVEAWWDHLNCEHRINAVNAISSDLETDHAVLAGDETFSPGSVGDNDSEREWCHAFDDLGANQQRAANAGAKQPRVAGGITTAADDRVFDMSGWWNDMEDEGRLLAIGGVDADVPDGPNGQLSQLTASVSARATAAYNALSGDAMTTEEDEEEEAPALPLVGVGILGLLLAGRGAWLRRRA